MKKVLLISFSNIYKDVRILRHINALKGNYEIITCGYGPAPDGVDHHFRIPNRLIYLPLKPQALFFNLLRLFRISYSKTPAVGWVKRNLSSGTNQIDLVFCNDVLTLGIPSIIGFQGKKIADMHEYAPKEMDEDWRFRFLLKKYYTYLCKVHLASFDEVITVSGGLAKEYLKDFKVQCQVVLNAREYRDLEVVQNSHGKVQLVHTGLASKNRKIENMILACEGSDDLSLDLYLVPAPRQKRYFKRLKSLSNQFTNVRILDPIPMAKIPEQINSYDVGLVFIYPSNFSLKHSLGNKIFDYIQARLAIVTGPSPEMSKIVKEENIGIVTQDFTVSSLKKSLSTLTFRQINEFKQSTAKLASTINAEKENQKIMDLIEKVFRN